MPKLAHLFFCKIQSVVNKSFYYLKSSDYEKKNQKNYNEIKMHFSFIMYDNYQ